MEQEADWILRAQRGDQRAFGDLVRAYQRPVYNLAYRMLGEAAAAEDAAQEAFLRAYRHLREYQSGRKFANWLLSITSHYCVDQLRRRRLTTVSLEGSYLPEILGDGHPGPEHVVERKEREVVIQRMLAQLSPEHRVVVALRYWYDLSYREIAQVVGISEGAVKSRLFRARGTLAQMWRKREAEG
jgi:RNA polymerase sigma-70 factor (ECF subfamily)